MKKKNILFVFALFLFFFVGAKGVLIYLGKPSEPSSQPPSQQTENRKALEEGDPLPAGIELFSVAKTKWSTDQYKGKVLLINFWASWCPPCLAEMPSLYQLQKKFEGKGLVVIGLSMDDDPEEGLSILKKKAGNPPFEIIRGQESSLSQIFPIEGLPYTVIIDRRGIIKYAKSGERDWAENPAVQEIEALL